MAPRYIYRPKKRGDSLRSRRLTTSIDARYERAWLIPLFWPKNDGCDCRGPSKPPQQRAAGRAAVAPWRCERLESTYPRGRISFKIAEHESQMAPKRLRGQHFVEISCPTPRMERLRCGRSGRTHGASLCTRGCGARPGEETAQKGGRRWEIFANPLSVMSVIVYL